MAGRACPISQGGDTGSNPVGAARFRRVRYPESYRDSESLLAQDLTEITQLTRVDYVAVAFSGLKEVRRIAPESAALGSRDVPWVAVRICGRARRVPLRFGASGNGPPSHLG